MKAYYIHNYANKNICSHYYCNICKLCYFIHVGSKLDFYDIIFDIVKLFTNNKMITIFTPRERKSISYTFCLLQINFINNRRTILSD